jgi:hypothetical protein
VPGSPQARARFVQARPALELLREVLVEEARDDGQVRALAEVPFMERHHYYLRASLPARREANTYEHTKA